MKCFQLAFSLDAEGEQSWVSEKGFAAGEDR